MYHFSLGSLWFWTHFLDCHIVWLFDNGGFWPIWYYAVESHVRKTRKSSLHFPINLWVQNCENDMKEKDSIFHIGHLLMSSNIIMVTVRSQAWMFWSTSVSWIRPIIHELISSNLDNCRPKHTSVGWIWLQWCWLLESKVATLMW